jgi:Flp pilus assembly protein TadG
VIPGMVMSAIRKLGRLAAARDGSAAIEFAFVLPVLLFILCAIFQIGLVFTANQVLEDATTEFARLIRTGQAQSGGLTKANFQQQFCDRIKVFLNCDGTNLLIDIQVMPSFGAVSLGWPIDGTGNFTGTGGYSLGAKEQTVLVRAFYQYPVWMPYVGSTLSTLPNGKRLLAASAAFRNEPF